MAIDNTPPRLRLIVTIAFIVVVTLVSLDFVFKSYYAYMSDAAQHEKLAPTKAKTEQQGAELASLAGAKIPIDQAILQLGKGTRSELIEPKPSDDLAPMTGWSKMPKQAPAPIVGATGPGGAHPATDPAMATHGVHPVEPAMSVDGGAAHAGGADAGAAHAAPAHAADAGAPKPTTPPATAVDAGAHAPKH